MAVNVKGSFLLAKHALAAMRDGGSLIFNSSVVGLLSDAGIAGYATSKHAIVGLMRTAAREVADRGIRVNSLHPGPVDNASSTASRSSPPAPPRTARRSSSRSASRSRATPRPRRSRARSSSWPATTAPSSPPRR